MAFERCPEREQLVRRGLQLPDDHRGDQPERDDRGARAEPARLRDVVGELKAPAVGRNEALERADAEVLAVDGAVARLELELVPEVERGAGAVEAGADVRGRGRGADAEDRLASNRVGVLETVAGDDADDLHVA